MIWVCGERVLRRGWLRGRVSVWCLCGALGVALSGCDILLQLLCDPEQDAACTDPERGQITGRITVPTASTAQTPPTVASDQLRRAIDVLQGARHRATRGDAAHGRVPQGKHLAPRAGVVPQRAWKAAAVPNWRPGEVIVRPHVDARQQKERFAKHLAAFLGDGTEVEISTCNTATLCLAKLTDASGAPLDAMRVLDVVQRLRRDAALRFVEPNLMLQMAKTPNDPFYPIQWHYGAMRLPTAWNITTGRDDIVAAVIDTGILENHPDLVGRIVGGADLIEDPDIANDGDGRDDNGHDDGDDACGRGCHSHHGTHVAGTMAANSDNATMVAGVSWAGQLLSVRVLGAGGGSLFDIVGGIYWAVGEEVDGVTTNSRPADVLNLSLGGRGDSEAMNEAITAAVEKGAIVVVAAGNDGADAGEYTPANAPNAITVAAVGHTGGSRLRPRRASYSNFGADVDVAAPGGEQAEDVDQDGHPDGVLSTLRDEVEFYQGTSMAAPHVAGLAMLMKSLDRTLSQDRARALLVQTANDNVDCQGCGAGMVNAAQALRAMTGDDALPLVVPVPDVTRVGRADLDAEIAFVNEGGVTTDVRVSVGGRDRERVTVDRTSATLAPGESLSLQIALDRTGTDIGEATLTAVFGENAIAEAKIFWTADVVNVAQSIDVGALRIDSDEIIPERIVTVSAADQYAYHLFNLPPGEYLVIGISDDDNDGVPESHEGIGVFPRIQESRLVSVRAGNVVEGVDFIVAPAFVEDNGPGGEGDGEVGAACSTSSDCQGDLYCEPIFVGGYCTQDCSVGSVCPAGSECYCLEDASGACDYLICLATCQDDVECRSDEGYICDSYQTCYPE